MNMKIGVSQKAIILNKEGKLLAVHRTETAPSNANRWDFPGGGINFKEDAIESIKREIKEETNLEVEDADPFDVIAEWFENGNWVTIGYVAKAKSKEVKLSYEHDEYKWVTPEEFLELDSADKLKTFVKNYVGRVRK